MTRTFICTSFSRYSLFKVQFFAGTIVYHTISALSTLFLFSSVRLLYIITSFLLCQHFFTNFFKKIFKGKKVPTQGFCAGFNYIYNILFCAVVFCYVRKVAVMFAAVKTITYNKIIRDCKQGYIRFKIHNSS